MRLVLPVLLSSVLVLVTASDWDDHRHDGQESSPNNDMSPCNWKCLLFTLQWPGSFCLSLSKGTGCRIPQSINTWTIHGLWPVHPNSCCDCWHMYPSDVQELEEELTQHWPSLLKSKSNFHFWRDEWKKHGVCAACAEGMNSPFKYFQICLKLQRQLDIQKSLEDGGITPSCQRPYKFPHFLSAPVSSFKGREVWFQVKTSMSRNLTTSCQYHDDSEEQWSRGPRRSFSHAHPCPPQLPFYYFPINHEQPDQPCN
uniref:Ribonuclease T2, like n=1 Tax=Cynoglossus semilaevis TaxID=244447 RepID=A0A3P8WD68_CYNSE